ncbi:MAG: leucine-rich repeat protein [Planctomycetia bacterium]|nr:leucine-rich repeat protein [Planctomycetia bacterium]
MNADFSLNGEKTHVPTGMGVDSEMLKLTAGQVVGKYRLVEKAGEGGMGVVWKALDTIGNRYVGLKFVPAEIRYRDDAMTQMIQAFSRVQALNHTHICPVYGLEKDPALGYYVVMKWLEGLSLDKLLKTDILRDENRVVSILQAVAEALDYAHARNVLHRDVKPSNIFVMMQDEELSDVFLIDFGLAAEIQDTLSQFSERSVNTSGTRPYMPPEQWRGEPQNARTDQYALGVVAYELFAGRRPFLISDVEMLRLSILQDVPKKIDGVSENINYAIQKALAKKPEERFSSCVEFISELKKEEEEKRDADSSYTINIQIGENTNFEKVFCLKPTRTEESRKKPIILPPVKTVESPKSLSLGQKIGCGCILVSFLVCYSSISFILCKNRYSDYEYEISENGIAIIEYKHWEEEELLKIPEKIWGCPVMEIGYEAFYYGNFESVVIPESVVIIRERAFMNSNITSVTVPHGVKELKYEAFSSCGKLKKVVLPDGLTTIGICAFRFCGKLEEINIPESVTDLNNSTFEDCCSLKTITIPGNVNAICMNVFKGCSRLTSVTILEGVKKIDAGAFEGCRALEAITIPGSVTEIDQEAFKDCGNFTIYGEKGSQAERFATEMGIPFKLEM